MSLTAKDVLEITRLLEASDFTELNLEIDGLKLNLRRGSAPSEPTVAVASEAVTESRAPYRAASAATPVAPTDPNLHDVVAPLLGTYYRAPKPGAPPFVEIGAAVEADTVIGIIEVMKLMNPVRAGLRGAVTDIWVSDGVLVEYAQPLIRVRKST